MKAILRSKFLAATLAGAALVGMAGCASDFERKMNYEIEKNQGEYDKCRSKDQFLRRSGKQETGIGLDDKCHDIYYGPWSKTNKEQTSGYPSSSMPGL